MPEDFTIRPAVEADAAAACELVRDCIILLCKADHFGDALTLEGWLANKTVKNFAWWFTAPGSNGFIAERNGEMIGVGAVRDDGEVTLNYVSPSARFQGVSKALLARMEETAKGKLADRMSLTTTETARRFYHDRGYREEDEEGDLFDGEQSAMIKPFET